MLHGHASASINHRACSQKLIVKGQMRGSDVLMLSASPFLTCTAGQVYQLKEDCRCHVDNELPAEHTSLNGFANFGIYKFSGTSVSCAQASSRI